MIPAASSQSVTGSQPARRAGICAPWTKSRADGKARDQTDPALFADVGAISYPGPGRLDPGEVRLKRDGARRRDLFHSLVQRATDTLNAGGPESPVPPPLG